MSLSLRFRAGSPLVLARILSAHSLRVPRTFSAFPKTRTFLADHEGVTYAAVFGPVVLFAGAISTVVALASSPMRAIIRKGEALHALQLALRWEKRRQLVEERLSKRRYVPNHTISMFKRMIALLIMAAITWEDL